MRSGVLEICGFRRGREEKRYRVFKRWVVAGVSGRKRRSPFVDSIILRCGAALTHVDARVREDAPKALKAVIDFAPRIVVTRRAPRETLSRFNAALLDSERKGQRKDPVGEHRYKKGRRRKDYVVAVLHGVFNGFRKRK